MPKTNSQYDDAMPLQDIQAHCEKDEARMDESHPTIDKLSDENDESDSNKTMSMRERPERIVLKATVTVISITFAAALVLWAVGVIPDGIGSRDRESTMSPSINSWMIVNTANGLMIWINASDTDDLISNVSIAVYANATPLGSLVFEKLYWVNQSDVNITDILFLGSLPAGEYVIEAHAVDTLGNASDTNGFRGFTLPA